MEKPGYLSQPGFYYKDLFNQMDQGYILVEVLFNADDQPTDIYYIEANSAANLMTGTELAGKLTSELDPNYEQHWYEIFGRVAKTGVAEKHQLRASPLGVHYQFHAFKVGQPEERKIAVIYEDITERRTAEEARLRAEEQFGAFVTASSNMVYKMSPDWKEMYNLNGKNMLADTGDPTGDWTEKYIPHEDRHLVWQAVEKSINAKSTFELEHRVIQADGAVGWVLSRAIPILDEGGHITEWLGAGIDITVSKLAEAQLASELADTQRLQRISSQIIQEDNIEKLYEEIVDAAMAIMDATSGSMQMYIPEKQALLLLVSRGFAPESASYWHWVDLDSRSTCGGALVNKQRFFIKDVETDNFTVGTDDLNAYRQSGIRSVQSTPLVSRKGNIVGMISTHWADVRESTERELRLLDVLARQAADLIERKHSEEALRKSGERLQLAINGANIFTWDVNPETGETKYSSNFNDVLGFETSESSVADVINIHPDDEKLVLQATADALTHKTPFDMEHRVINPRTKEETWVRAQGQMVQKSAGDYSFIGITQNITERRLAEEVLKNYSARLEQEVSDRTSELRQNYALVQTIYDTTLIGMSVFAPVRDEQGTITDFKIVMVNKKVERTSGLTDMVGKLYSELFPGVKTIGLFEAMVKTFNTGKSSKMEYYYGYEGIDRWYSTMFVKGEDVLVSTNLDITERVKAEDERFRNYLLLQQSEELAQTGSWDFDLLSGTFSWSEGMYRLFDLQKGIKVKPEIYLEYATAATLPAAERVVAHIRAGDREFEETLEINTAGKIKVVHLKATVVTTDAGQPVRVLGVDMDMTAMQEAERRLRHLEARQQQEIFQVTLNTQEEERRRISESLHNGLGQLLYGTRLAMNYLTVKMATEKPERFNESKSYAAGLLTDSIKETRRISHELMPTVLAEFGLNAAIKDICGQLQDGVKFHCRVLLGNVKLDNYIELAVFRTVQELMVNVVKHAQAKSANVKVSADTLEVRITVRDNGKGIMASRQDKPGIGLMSIRNKVELLKGSVDILSVPGNGTTVEVRLPLQQFHEG